MGVIITFGIQKGGCGKSTSSAITAYLLSELHHYRVLAVDMDAQGDLTELLSGTSKYHFQDRTVFEAMEEMNASRYIQPLSPYLDILPAGNRLITFGDWSRDTYPTESTMILKKLLHDVKDRYDYIIIDTPPNLSDRIVVNSLTASDFAVIMFEPSKQTYNALKEFWETIVDVKKRLNSKIKIAGILRTIFDLRSTDGKMFLDVVANDYPKHCFNSVIRRRTAAKRLALMGFKDNKELGQVTEQYKPFVKELIERVK